MHLRRGPRLTPGSRRITFKVLLFPDLATATPALGWLMQAP